MAKEERVSIHILVNKDVYEKLQDMCNHHGDLSYIVREVLRVFVEGKGVLPVKEEKE